ncbi:MAG: hypothetical protein LQ339_008475 [Xanthoria mediterranea]|nr:MAG: hypothetical protein LQ339_008475 [Xanthoria mediterranea]
MHYPPAGLLALLYICAAWPVQDVSMPRSLSLKTPPARISSSALHSDLRLPISPDHGGNLLVYPSMHHRMGVPPKRSELAMTLAIGAYWYWMENSNGALKHRRVYRGKPPFENFRHEIFPANLPAAPLTPVKLGTAYCRMLLYILSREITSGLLTARLLTETNRVMIGIVSIENKPEFGKGMPSVSNRELEQSTWANQTLNSSLRPHVEVSSLQASDEMQRRWFGCLARMLFSIMANNQAGLVEEQMSSRGLPSKTYHFPCNDTDPYKHDYVALTIYLAASRCALTWRQLAEQLVVLGSAVAIGHSARTIVPVKSSDTLLATLRISVDG